MDECGSPLPFSALTFFQSLSVTSKNPQQSPVRKDLHVTDEETEAQRGKVTCIEQGKSKAITWSRGLGQVVSHAPGPQFSL